MIKLELRGGEPLMVELETWGEVKEYLRGYDSFYTRAYVTYKGRRLEAWRFLGNRNWYSRDSEFDVLEPDAEHTLTEVAPLRTLHVRRDKDLKMRIESDMNDGDIQKFFNTYMKQALPSALCKRVAQAVRQSVTDTLSDEERQMLLDFANKIEVLEYSQRKIEDSL